MPLLGIYSFIGIFISHKYLRIMIYNIPVISFYRIGTSILATHFQVLEIIVL